jgi:sugar/nucleoside kinase (ribokinase family)
MNKTEFQLGLNTDENDINLLIKESRKNKINQPFAVTLGVEGCVLIEKNKKQFTPAFFHKTIDTVGSGDAFFAITTALNKLGKDYLLTTFIGNMYAGLHALNVGNKKFVNKDELKNSINEVINLI